MKQAAKYRSSERGSAGTKFMLILVVIVLIGNAGFNYVPVAYQGENFKQEMQTTVVNGLALPGTVKPVDTVRAKIQRAAADNNLPPDAFMEIKQVGGVIQAHVAYSKQVGILPFGIYNYTYQFDHTATPTGFLLKSN